jgi:hypothetical protein
VAIAVSWAVSVAGLIMLVEWTKDINRMVFLGCGSILSSATVLSWCLRACQAAPFLYVSGWMMQSWVLTNLQGWAVVALLVDLGIATAWTIINPLVVRTIWLVCEEALQTLLTYSCSSSMNWNRLTQA